MKILYVEPSLCTGCRSCELACSFIKTKSFSPVYSRIQVATLLEDALFVPMVCSQCEDAPCVGVCPTGALYRPESGGVVLMKEERCIGCRMCVVVCPFGSIAIRGDDKVASKCDLCGGDPECVKFCFTGAISYVDSDTHLLKKRAQLAKLITKWGEAQISGCKD